MVAQSCYGAGRSIGAPGSISTGARLRWTLLESERSRRRGRPNMWYTPTSTPVVRDDAHGNRPNPGGPFASSVARRRLQVYERSRWARSRAWPCTTGSGGLLAFTISLRCRLHAVDIKRSKPQNIVIGGARALSAMVGWAAAGPADSGSRRSSSSHHLLRDARRISGRFVRLWRAGDYARAASDASGGRQSR